ncbi:class I SAM-dependent methyltransferase [bacterium]|nr:class I SAM-dependent methyltransferase [bacterium]
MGTDNDNIQKRFDAVSCSRTFRHLVQSFSLEKKKVLDVGCSYGEFLAHFGDGSAGLSIAGDEVEYGKSRGLDTRFRNIEDDECGFSSEKFDVIFANNIFEHLLSPHMFLQKIRVYLREDGILILGVPCVPMISPLIRFSKFRGALASNHINFFTRKTLMLTVLRGGWEVREARSFHFSNKYFDTLLHGIAPHFYVIATPDTNFAYNEKRLKELAGYDIFNKTNESNGRR